MHFMFDEDYEAYLKCNVLTDKHLDTKISWKDKKQER